MCDDRTMAFMHGFPGWTSQDFGTTMVRELDGWHKGKSVTFTPSTINTLGGGGGGNDQRIATGLSYWYYGPVPGAQEWLKAQANNPPNIPFCLIVSLLNPHDVFVSPAGYESAGYQKLSSGQYPWQVDPFTNIKILPESYDLAEVELANKPLMQNAYRWTPAQDTSQEDQRAAAALDYLRFYVYLETLSDARTRRQRRQWRRTER